VTGVVHRRHCSDEEKGQIVAEAIAAGAVVAGVARRHDLVPQRDVSVQSRSIPAA
jgi:transposase-like protein